MKIATWIVAVTLGLLLLVLGACSTTEGLGKDIEKAGKGLKDSADRNGG